MVCRELLRNHPQVTVRALVRSASDPYQGYGRLSYEVGAEEGKMDIAPAWRIGDGGGFSESVTVEFDEERQRAAKFEQLVQEITVPAEQLRVERDELQLQCAGLEGQFLSLQELSAATTLEATRLAEEVEEARTALPMPAEGAAPRNVLVVEITDGEEGE